MFNKKYIPKSTLLELTLKCNMNCLHCGSAAGYKRKNELTTEQWFNVCDQLSNLNCELITILGGEPLIREDWFEVSQRVKDLGMKLTIISNGYNIDEKVINKFRKLDPYTIGISMDGATKEVHDSIRRKKGSYEKSIDALKKLRKANINTTVVTTVSKINLKELPKMRDFLLNKEIAWQIQIAVPMGRFSKKLMLSKKEFYALCMFIAISQQKYSFKELPIMGAHSMGYFSKNIPNIMLTQWNGCPAGLSVLSIESDGSVIGCLSLSKNYIEGNIKNQKIEEIWNDQNKFSYNRNFNQKNLKNQCADCGKGKFCRGGCMAVSTSVTNQENSNPYCMRSIERNLKLKG